MTANLYRVLGVKRSATPAEIKTAYRSKSKTAHPDGGGSAEAFAKLRLAYSILSDAARRAEYDRTGKVEEPKADNALAEILQEIAQLVVGILTADQEPFGYDLIAVMRKGAAQKRDKAREELARLRAIHARASKLLGRFSTKSENNHLDSVLTGHATLAQQQIVTMEASIARLGRVDQFLADYRFARDAPPVQAFGMFFQHITS